MTDVWTSLLFGSGFWLGLLLQLCLLFVVSMMIPKFGYLGAVYCMMMMMVYSEQIASSDVAWLGVILLGVAGAMLAYIGYKG